MESATFAANAAPQPDLRTVLEKNGQRIQYPAPLDKRFAGIPNFNAFPGLSPVELHFFQACAIAFRDYLTRPIITDQFENDHVARSAWLQKMVRQYGQGFLVQYNRSKLRANAATTVLGCAFRIFEMLQRRRVYTQSANNLRFAMENLPLPGSFNYSHFTEVQKLELAAKLDRFCLTFLEQVT